jgi:hypothetical protein
VVDNKTPIFTGILAAKLLLLLEHPEQLPELIGELQVTHTHTHTIVST